MSNSLSEQLLKAGLITEEQVTQAEQDRQQQKDKARARANTRKKETNASGKQAKSESPRNKARKPKPSQTPQATDKPEKTPPKQSASDLAKFYRERDNLERQEREAEEKRRREKAERKKKTRQQIRELIATNQVNVADASIRYNFVVGETVKYVFVTEQQRIDLAAGSLAVTFMDGKRCLIPVAVAGQIHELDPDKLVVINDPSQQAVMDDEIDRLLAEAETQAETEAQVTSDSDTSATSDKSSA